MNDFTTTTRWFDVSLMRSSFKTKMMERILKTPPVINPVDKRNPRPLWSVMIPAYNCMQHLPKAIQSVLDQDQGPERMQIEVVDDGSTDGDVEQLVRDIGQGRVLYFRQPQNVGHHRNFATCLNRSRGEYVHLLHGDDKVKPGFYKEIETLFCNHPSAGAAFTNNEYINEKDELTYQPKSITSQHGILPDFLYSIAQKQMLQFSAMVVKRHVYEHLGGFCGVNYCEDWYMWIRIAAHYPIAYSPKLLAQYRGGLSNTGTITNSAMIKGENFSNILKVIDMSQQYIPHDKRKYIKAMAKKNYAEHIAKASNSIYHVNRKVAFKQSFSAVKMYQSPRTIYQILRLLMLYTKDQIGFRKMTLSPAKVKVHE